MRAIDVFALGALALAPMAHADWVVAPASSIQFVSVKNSTVGELNRFESVSGTVTDAGEIVVEVALDSVQTGIDIRNERLKNLLFEIDAFPRATISGQLDGVTLTALIEQGSAEVTLPLTVDLHGQSVVKQATLRAHREGDSLRVATVAPILLNASEFGIEAGVAALQEIAGLKAISRVIPVTVDLTLTR
jgi:polyisoprenoid-binding protein YceI